MVPCSGKNSVNGGCGILVRCEDMEFHLSTLCKLRGLSCKWASYGCEERVAGAAEARHHHETNECPYRLVSCRNGCELSGRILACFAEEHYRWQCMLEKKGCSNHCHDSAGQEVKLPEHLMMVHALQDAGACPLRKTYCPLDLCGKHIRLFDSELERVDSLMSGDEKIARSDGRIMNANVIKQRLLKYKELLARMKSVQHQTLGPH